MSNPLPPQEETVAFGTVPSLQVYSNEASREEIKEKIARTELLLQNSQINAKRLLEEREECIRNLMQLITETSKQRDEARQQLQFLRRNFSFHYNAQPKQARKEMKQGKMGVHQKTVSDIRNICNPLLANPCQIATYSSYNSNPLQMINAGAPLQNSYPLPHQPTVNSNLCVQTDEYMNSLDQNADFSAGVKGWTNSIDDSCNELAQIFEPARVKKHKLY